MARPAVAWSGARVAVAATLGLGFLGGASAASAQRVVLGARTGSSAAVELGTPTLPRAFGPSDARLWDRLVWTPVARGLSWSEVQLAAGVLRLPVRTVIVRLDPRAYDLRLELATAANGMTGAWTVADADPRAALALNAGQFKETGPWGWLVLDGEERRDPGVGPLSVGIAVTDSGTVRWISPDRLRGARDDPHVRWAFQTFPVLLSNGSVPALAVDPGSTDLDHRDARLVLGQRSDGVLVIVLTRFDALGEAAQRVPIGLTVPESIALLGALGASQAAMLDGGISAQLRVRGRAGPGAAWPGLRKVPLGLIAIPRPN